MHATNTTQRNSLEEVRRIVIHNGGRHSRRNKTYPQEMVEKRSRYLECGRTQKQFHVIAGRSKFHQRLKRHFSHIPSRAEPIEEKDGESRTASCANASLPRVRESRWQQQTGADGRSVRTRSRRHRADKRVGKTTKKRATPQREPKKRGAATCEGHGGHHLAIFATLPTAIVDVTRS